MNSYKRIALATLFPIFLFSSSSATAISIGGFDPIKAATRIVTAPTQTVINAVQVVTSGADAKTILDPTKDAARSVAPLPVLVTNVAVWPQNEIFKHAQALAASTGQPGEAVFDVATFAQNYHNNLVQSSGIAAANVLLGKNPLEVVAMPLAAAIREARARHIGNAKPLPEDVKIALANFFPPSVLNRAKYVVGKVEITLPNGIGKVRQFFRDEVAVVVDDVIVFPSDPGTFKNDPQWWGHEVTHVKQYMDWGIDSFAYRYVTSLSREIENPAYERGDAVLAWAQQNFRTNTGVLAAITTHNAHLQATPQNYPLLPAAYVKMRQDIEAAQAQADPPIIRCFFSSDPLEYYGTQSGRIIVVDRAIGQWMQIGWAAPPDVPGPAWVYLIPGRGSYDVLPNGQIVQRFTPGPYGPGGPPGPPMQVGHVARLQ